MKQGFRTAEHLSLSSRMTMVVLCILLSYTSVFSGELMKKGDDLYRAGKFFEAIPVYKQALRAEENPPITHFNIANCWFQLDSLSKAAVHYDLTISQAPEFVRAYLNLGIVHFNMDQFGSAVSVLERGRIEDPENLTMIQVLAESYRRLKKYDHAIPLYLELIDRDSSKVDSWFVLAEMSRELGDGDEAAAYVKNYPDAGRRQGDKYFMLAEIAEERGRFSEAVFYLNQYAALNPKDRWPHYKCIALIQKQGNPLSAVFKAQETVKKFPDFSDAALLGGNIAFAEKQFRFAEELYLIAYKNGSAGGVTGLNNLNRYFTRTGDRESSNRIARILALQAKKQKP